MGLGPLRIAGGRRAIFQILCPDWRSLPQRSNAGDDGSGRAANFILGRETAETQANGGAGTLVVHAHGGKDVTRLETRARASRPARDRYFPELADERIARH